MESNQQAHESNSPSTLPVLFQNLRIEDERYLIKSTGVDYAILQRSGIFSSSESKSENLIGLRAAGIMFPYFDLTAELVGYRLRLNQPKGDLRYFQKAGSELNCYFLQDYIPAIVDLHKPLLVTEGEKKLLSLTSLFPSEAYGIVSYPGCWNFLLASDQPAAPKRLAKIWTEIPIRNRKIIWIPDTDFFLNHNVHKAGTIFVELIRAAGGTVEMIDLRSKGRDFSENWSG